MQDLKRVFTHLGPFKKEFILSILFIIAETGFELTIPLIMADIIDVGVQTRDIHYICIKGVQMGICALLSLITGLLYARYAARAALGFGSGVREAEFSRIQSYSFANLGHFSTSSLITRMTTDITVMQNAITGGLRPMVRGPVMLIMGLFLAFWMNAALALVFVICTPVLACILFFIVRRVAPLYGKLQVCMDRVNAAIQENLTAIRAVKAFVREEYEEEVFEKANRELADTSRTTFHFAVLNLPAFQLTMYTSIVLILWFAAEKILAAIEAVDIFDGVRLADYDEAMAAGRIVEIGDDCLDAFVDAVYAQRVGSGEGIADLNLVYTPLNGSGLECERKLLGKLGVTHVTVVPEQEKPDGDFPTCPYPNPEIREAMQKGLELCDKVHPDLLLGTDPDCDRCGAAVPDGQGGYRLITGNEMGIILLDYICRTRLAKGTMPKDPVAVTTIVSTDMATPVAKKYGVELRRTLTGFKFIGEQIGKLEAEGHAERFIFGFEESYGYLSAGHVRDKDAVNATLLVCEAAAWYAAQGKTLLDAIEGLYKEYGYYRNALCSFEFEGESGMHTMQALMQRLRDEQPLVLAGYGVEDVIDYNAEGTGLPRADVLEYRLAGGHKFMVRASGTEPKIKVYLSAVGPSEAAADVINATLAEAAEKMMKA